MDPGQFAAAWESLKVATSIGKALVDLKVEGEVRTKVSAINDALFEAQRRMLEAQDSHAEMAKKVQELEEALKQYERWEQEKKRYQLAKTDAGTLLYRLRADCLDGEPEHDLCPVCFQDEVKSILQVGTTGEVAHCPRCKTSIRLKVYRDQLAEIARIGRDLNGPDRGF